MKYHVLMGDVHHAVEVQADGAGLRVTIGDESLHVDFATLQSGRAYSLIIDGRSVDVGVEEHGDSVDLLISGRRHSTDVLGEREYLARSIKAEQGGGDATVKAVMSGIVRDVRVAVGDEVSAGQVLLILEAMKMENEVKAEVDGTVSSVSVESGMTVERGDVIIEIE